MLTANPPPGATLQQCLMATGMGGREAWPQYVSESTGRAHCSWVDCRAAYDRAAQLAAGLIAPTGNRQFFCSDACRRCESLEVPLVSYFEFEY